jgi:hypothetical protein
MWEQIIRIEVPINCICHPSSPWLNEDFSSWNKSSHGCKWKLPSYKINSSSIKVSVVQPSDQLIIYVDTQSYRPINGSIDNLRTSKCMHPIQMKDTLRKFFNLGVQLRFQ